MPATSEKLPPEMILQCLRTLRSQQHKGSTSHWLNLTCGLISRLDPLFSMADHRFQSFHVWVPCLKSIFKMRKPAYIGHLVFFANQDAAAEKIKLLQPCSDILWFRLPWSIMNRLRSALDSPSDCSLVVCICNISAGSPSFSFWGSHEIANA